MKPGKRNLSSRLVAASLLLLGGAVWAAQPVAVSNPGFENPVLAEFVYPTTIPNWSQGKYDVLAPAVWIAGGSAAGPYNLSTSEYASATAPEGSNMAYTTTAAGFDTGISQVLTATLQADAEYNLSVKVGNPALFNLGLTADYRIELLAGGVLLQSAAGPSPADDTTFTTATLTYSSGAAPAQLGQPLGIRLLAKDFTTDYEVDFDDVQLTATYTHPVANPGGPYSVAIPSGSLTLDGSASLPSDGSSLSLYEWDLNNDDTYDLTGATPATVPYLDLTTTHGMIAGSNTIKLRVTDATTAETATATTTVTLAIPSTTLSTGNWQGGAWSNGQPTGSGLDAIIAGNAAANATVTAWSGALYVNSGVTLTVSGTAADFIAVEGATNTYLNGIILNNWKSQTVTSNFILSGGGRFNISGNAAFNQDQIFSGVFSGTGGFTVRGGNHQGMKFTNANNFTGGFTAESQNQRYGLGLGTGSAGAGNVTTSGVVGQQGPVIEVRENNPFASSATLSLNGSGFNNSTGGFGPYTKYLSTSFLIDINGKTATVDKLFVNGVQQAAGTYVGGGAPWIGDKAAGAGGTLIVTTGPVDNTAPTLAGSGFVDNKSGGPITAFETVLYTVTFSEPMKVTSIGTDDFENAVSPAATINSVTATGNPAVFTVSVTPGGTGTLQLQVKAGAVLEDMAANPLDTAVAIPDDTTITVNPDPLPSLVSIVDNMAGGPVLQNQSFTYFVTFSQVMNPATLDATDFENGTGPAVTVTNVIATGNPAVFAVDVTPGGTGTITLQIKAGAALTNTNGTALDTTSALPDDTTITVNAGSVPLRGTITVDGSVAWSAASGTLSGTLDASGSDKLVVIVTGETGNPGDLSGNCTGVTYDGVALTQVVDRIPIGGTPYDQTFNDIWYLDNPATATGAIVASVNGRGSVTALALSGTAPGVGATTISPQASKTVVFTTTAANSIVIASHGMGGDGNTANVSAVDAVLPLIERSATAQASGAPSPWDGHVTAAVLVPTVGTAPYSFTGGNLVGSHVIAAEFLAADPSAGTPYENWAATNAPGSNPELDFDGDGVPNAVEFVLGGDKDTNDLGKLPAVATSAGDMTFSFVRDQDSIDGTTVVVIEVGTDLATWNTPPSPYAVPDAATGPVNPGVTVVKDVPAGFDTVTLTVPQAPAPKKFARLKVTVTP